MIDTLILVLALIASLELCTAEELEAVKNQTQVLNTTNVTPGVMYQNDTFDALVHQESDFVPDVFEKYKESSGLQQDGGHAKQLDGKEIYSRDRGFYLKKIYAYDRESRKKTIHNKDIAHERKNVHSVADELPQVQYAHEQFSHQPSYQRFPHQPSYEQFPHHTSYDSDLTDPSPYPHYFYKPRRVSQYRY